jgi:hypothetical protein
MPRFRNAALGSKLRRAPPCLRAPQWRMIAPPRPRSPNAFFRIALLRENYNHRFLVAMPASRRNGSFRLRGASPDIIAPSVANQESASRSPEQDAWSRRQTALAVTRATSVARAQTALFYRAAPWSDNYLGAPGPGDDGGVESWAEDFGEVRFTLAASGCVFVLFWIRYGSTCLVMQPP